MPDILLLKNKVFAVKALKENFFYYLYENIIFNQFAKRVAVVAAANPYD
jgi:hypothetical protein